MQTRELTVEDHRRDSADMRYVYPVVSRRAGGISIGINLNVNNACNWACTYCQVDGLTRGGPPPVDLPLLKQELENFILSVVNGEYLQRVAVPAESRRLVDVAFSGNGEPTSAAEFEETVKAVRDVLGGLSLPGVVLRLITNGSLMHRAAVQRGVRLLGEMGGEVWFKVDRANDEAILKVNRVRLRPEQARRNLEICSRLAPTWIQTCWFGQDGVAPSGEEREAYCRFLSTLEAPLQGVHLYGLARPSRQPDAGSLVRLQPAELEDFAREITKKTGVRVVSNP